jgi:hypothetical protein
VKISQVALVSASFQQVSSMSMSTLLGQCAYISILSGFRFNWKDAFLIANLQSYILQSFAFMIHKLFQAWKPSITETDTCRYSGTVWSPKSSIRCTQDICFKHFRKVLLCFLLKLIRRLRFPSYCRLIQFDYAPKTLFCAVYCHSQNKAEYKKRVHLQAKQYPPLV